MDIIFDKNIMQFKNKTEFQIISLIPKYRKYYKPIFLKFINELSFDSKFIESIHIIHNKKSYGTTIPKIQDGQILFEIELSDDILLYISEIQNSLETFKSKSIFQHEISHCIEIKTLYESKITNIHDILNKNLTINTTYDFLYSKAVAIWSEFFACYNNRKYNVWHEVSNGEDDITQLIKWIHATKYHLNTHEDVRLCEDMLIFLHNFWYNMISMIAIHLHNNEDIIINDYKNSSNQQIQIYFNYIYDIFKSHLNHYPYWLDEKHYLDLGKSLMKILEIYGITPNVLMASYLLKEKLNQKGISTIVEDTNLTEFLELNNWNHASSYKASRIFMLDKQNTYKSLKYYIDIHRDSVGKSLSTTTINDKPYARILFVVGLEHPNYQKNLNLANKLNDLFNKHYKGLSRGVLKKEGQNVNGIYNQDITENSMLIELGGVDNNIDEVLNTINAIADILNIYIKENNKQ